MENQQSQKPKWSGCDKLKDLKCEYPHCTCAAKAVGNRIKAEQYGTSKLVQSRRSVITMMGVKEGLARYSKR